MSLANSRFGPSVFYRALDKSNGQRKEFCLDHSPVVLHPCYVLASLYVYSMWRIRVQEALEVMLTCFQKFITCSCHGNEEKVRPKRVRTYIRYYRTRDR